MNKGDPFYAIVLCAAELKRTNLERWPTFIEALKVYQARCRQECIVAPKGQRGLAQGQAQTVDQLVDKLENCLELEIRFRRG